MPISNPTPAVIPATSEKQFPHIWIKNIQIHSPSTTKGRATFNLCPYNATTGEILDQPRMVVVDDLWAKVAESAEFQAAMVAILAAVDTIK